MSHQKDFVKYKQTVFGLFSKTSDPQFIEIIGKSGFDFIILDLEHGPNSVKDLISLINTCRSTDLSPIVRVGEISAIQIQRILDLGVDGIQIPQIRTKEDLDDIQQYTRFASEGQRGACRFVKAADYSLMDQKEYYRQQNQVLRIVHLEGKEGYSLLDTFLTHPAVDILFIGPYDLSHSLGCPGEIDSPEVLKVIEDIIDRCNKNGKKVGIFTDTREQAAYFRKMGIHYLTYSVDTGLFAESCRNLVRQLKNLT